MSAAPISGDLRCDGEPMAEIGGRAMCEIAVKELGLSMTPEELWSASPTGELFHVVSAYIRALKKRGHKIEVYVGTEWRPYH